MESLTGIMHVTTAPMEGSVSTFYGTTPSVTVDNVPNDTYLVTCLCNAPFTTPWPNPHTVNGQTFRVRQNGNLIFEDVNASYVVEREARPDLGVYPNGDPWLCPKTVTVTGSSPAGSYTGTFTNFRWNEAHDKLVMDCVLTATAGLIGQTGGNGEEDPPIVRH